MNDAGRIGFLIKGDYDANATYEFLDVVYYEGASYVAKTTTTGNTPVRSNEYWQIFAEGVSTDSALSDSSTNAVQNKVIASELNNKAKKEIYGDTFISFSRKENTTVGIRSVALHGEASNTDSVAIGGGVASGAGAVAIGDGSKSTNYYSFSTGQSTASGIDSFASGYEAAAKGDYSCAQGENTIASGKNQHAFGKYNVEDAENKYVEIVGGGNASVRKNIRTLDWNGNAFYAGTMTAEGGSNVYRYGSNNSSVGYAKIAHITIIGTYIDKPIALKIATRDGAMSELRIMFSGDAHTDPNVKYFTVSGINSAFLVRTAASEWDLYIYNRAWQDIDVVDYKFPYYLSGKVKIAWTQEFETTLPTGFVAATRVDSVLNTVEACEASTNSFDLAGAAAVKELNGRFATGTASVDVINGFGTFSIDYTFETIPFIVFQPIGYIISGNTVVSVVPVDITTSRANCRITFSIAANMTVNIKWFAFGN